MKNQTNSVKTPFSTSELRVVELLAQGYTEKEIAEKLCISPHTVNNHLRNIRETSANIQNRLCNPVDKKTKYSGSGK